MVKELHYSFFVIIPKILFNVHGGIIFSGELKPPLTGFWYGFDCAHLDDLMPFHLKKFPQFGINPSDVYRDINYVKKECESLAKQLKECEGTKLLENNSK